MVSISEHFRQSELALASSASLTIGTRSMDELSRDATGMSAAEAAQFAESWTVVDQFTDPPNGVFATVFRQCESSGGSTERRCLAIRGAEPSALDLTANGLLALGLLAALNPQLKTLKAQINNWRSDANKLGSNSFPVTGHSPCSNLAAAAIVQYGSQASDGQQLA